eukprot:c11405_g1_i1.p1 GENE.c11405_g1_i1~~c11405_g1_i1.p1  ORF type:complete len:116 (+),score=49.42 c11405_g1_i1:70-417(+)
MSDWKPNLKERSVIAEANRERNLSMIVRGLVGLGVGFALGRFVQRLNSKQFIAAGAFSLFGVASGYISGEIAKAQELCRTEGSTYAPILYKNLKARGYSPEQINRRMGTNFTENK